LGCICVAFGVYRESTFLDYYGRIHDLIGTSVPHLLLLFSQEQFSVSYMGKAGYFSYIFEGIIISSKYLHIHILRKEMRNKVLTS
jgi:hypothetical protein